MKRIISLIAAISLLMTFASFPAFATVETYNKRVKIFTMGDSYTQGVIQQNAYRYYIYEPLIRDGAVFEFIGAHESQDFRVSSLYNHHGGYGGAVIGCAKDYEWNGTKWESNAWTEDNTAGTATIKYNGTMNSIHYRLFAGSDGTNDYTKTEYGNYVKEADIVTLYIGLNDYFSSGTNGLSCDLGLVKERYYTVVDRIFEINPNVSLYVTDLNEVPGLRGYGLTEGDAGYENSLYKYNEFILNEVVSHYTGQGFKIQGISLNQDGYKLIRGVDNPEDDGHPNANGNYKIGTQIYNAIKDEVFALNAASGDTRVKEVTDLTLSDTALTLKKGENKTITFSVTPADAEVKTVLLSSNNESVATVDYYGRITAVGEGTAVITAKSLDDETVYKTCTVTVTSDEYTKVSDGKYFIELLHDNFTSKDTWTGDVANISTGYRMYKHNTSTGASSITSVESVALGNNFSLSFGVSSMSTEYKEATDSNINTYYASLTVGKYQLRVAINGKAIDFYYDGVLKERYTFDVAISRDNSDRYTLAKKDGTVYVYRNNELLFTSTDASYGAAEGNAVINCKGWVTNNVREVVLKTELDVEDGTVLPGTIKVNSIEYESGLAAYAGELESIIDGDISTGWIGKMNWSGNYEHSFVLDLGKNYYVTGLEMYWGSATGGYGKISNKNTVYVSSDKSRWQPINSYYDPDYTVTTWNGEIGSNAATLTAPVEARYIRVVSHENGGARGLGVLEMFVKGYDGAPTPVNYTVNCVNDTTGEVFATQSGTGYVGMSVEIPAPDHSPAYDLKSALESVLFDKNAKTITYRYSQQFTDENSREYTVKYEDENGTELLTAVTTRALIGAVLNIEPIDIAGYVTPAAQQLTVSADAASNIVTFVYATKTVSEPVLIELTADNVIEKGAGRYPGSNKDYGDVDAMFDGVMGATRPNMFVNSYTVASGNTIADATNATKRTFIIDLGADYDLSTMNIYWGGAGVWGIVSPDSYTLYTAPSAEEGQSPVYTEFVTYSDMMTAVRAGTANSTLASYPNVTVKHIKTPYESYNVTETMAGTTARYIKIEINRFHQRVGIREIEVYGSVATGGNKVATSYTVKYLDTEGNPVATEKNVTDGAYVGNRVSEDAVDVEGYSVDAQSKALVLTADAAANVITFTYTKKTATSYTVNYLDEEGTPLISAKTVTTGAYVGDTAIEAAASIEGYVPDEKSKSLELTADANANVITFTYSVDKTLTPASVTATKTTVGTVASIWDGDTATYHQAKVDGGDGTAEIIAYTFNFGETYNFSKISSLWGYFRMTSGYVYVSEDGENWGDPVLTFDNVSYTNETAGGSAAYRANWELPAGTQGKHIKIAVTKASYTGENYITVREVSIEGERPAGEATSYTVKYEDADGNTLSPAKTVTTGVYVGDVINETAIAITGYTPVKTSDSITLSADANANVITFVYNASTGYNITLNAIDCTVTGLPTKANGGAAVEFTVDSENVGLSITDSEGNNIGAGYADGVWSFTMPESAVTVTVKKGVLENVAGAAEASRDSSWNIWFNGGHSTTVAFGGENFTNDGNDTTYANFSTTTDRNFVYDLGGVYYLNKVTMKLNNATSVFSISISENGADYTTVVSSFTNAAKGTFDVCVTGKARYVKVTFHTTSGERFYEIGITGVSASDTVYSIPKALTASGATVTAEKTSVPAGDTMVFTISNLPDFVTSVTAVTESGQRIPLTKLDRTDVTYGGSTIVCVDSRGEVRYGATMPASNITNVEIEATDYSDKSTVTITDSNSYAMGRSKAEEFNRLEWSGSSIEIEFTGTTIGFEIVADSVDYEIFAQIDDCAQPEKFVLEFGLNKIMLNYKGLDSGTHTLKIVRGNDAWKSAKLYMTKAYVDTSAVLTEDYTPEFDLKIEFVGDSITCGAVNPFVKSYCFLTGEYLNAETSYLALSGRGLYMNSDGKTASNSITVPEFYDCIHFTSTEANLDHAYTGFDADVVVINLGTNDMNYYDDTHEEAFKATYKAFLDDVLTQNPRAKVICCSGAMSVSSRETLKTLLEEIVAEYNNPNVTTFMFDYKVDQPEYNAEDGHPGPISHARDALKLTSIIKEMFPAIYGEESANYSLETVGSNIRPRSTNISAGYRVLTSFDKSDLMFAKIYGGGQYAHSDSNLVQFGTLMVPQDLLGGYTSVKEMFLAEGTATILDIVAKRLYSQNDTNVSFTGVLTEIPESDYDRVISSVGYVRYRASETEAWSYYFAPQKDSSYYLVAKTARESDFSDEAVAADPSLAETAAQLQAIIDAVENA